MRFLYAALAGFCQGFCFVLGERACILILNYVRDRRDGRRSFYGQIPSQRDGLSGLAKKFGRPIDFPNLFPPPH